MEQQNEKPYTNTAPDRINEIGTKFWDVHDFDDLIEKLPLEGLCITYSEYTDENGETFFGYRIIEDNDVVFEASYKEDVLEFLEAIKTETIERGHICPGEEE